ncbi:RipA family octameric membrane protein [Agarivorans sp. QJM3NY_29]|uniref:RipA family octameric membrane protein n=1 Tax=unclassified Agarivorans TaxID=2636026 RepID=UPI003D7E3D0E
MEIQKEFTIENVFGDLVHYYEVRMVALSDFSTRTWNRFNWFLTVHLAAFGFIFSSLVKVESSHWYLIASITVGFTALIWSCLGYEDFHQMQRYSKECKEIESTFLSTLKEREGISFMKPKSGQKVKFPFKQTRLLYLFPLILFSSWCGLSFYLV